MKYGLLFSDFVAWLVGLFVLLASIITLQKGILHWIDGSKTVGMSIALMGVFLFLQVRKFTVTKAYDQMLNSAVKALPRTIFITVCLFSMVWIATMILNTRPEDIFGLSIYAPWLFSPALLMVVGLCFCLVYIAPGIAFQPYRQRVKKHASLEDNSSETYSAAAHPAANETPERIYTKKPATKVKQSVPVRPQPIAFLVGRLFSFLFSGLVLTGVAAFIFGKTHASIEYMEDAWIMLVPLTLIGFLGCYLPYCYGKRIIPETGEILYSPMRKFFLAIFYMAIAIGCAFLPYYYTVPSAYNAFLTKEIAELPYTVNERVSYKGCRTGLSFGYAEDTSKSFHVCGLDRSFHARVAVGDTIMIRGPISYYGHTAETLRILLPGYDL